MKPVEYDGETTLENALSLIKDENASESQAESTGVVSTVMEDTAGMGGEFTVPIQERSTCVDKQSDPMGDVVVSAQQRGVAFDKLANVLYFSWSRDPWEITS